MLQALPSRTPTGKPIASGAPTPHTPHWRVGNAGGIGAVSGAVAWNVYTLMGTSNPLYTQLWTRYRSSPDTPFCHHAREIRSVGGGAMRIATT